MIGVDTNVLVRFLLDDDKSQAAVARRAFDRFTADQPGFIALIALVETAWVLRSAARFSKAEVTDAIIALTGASQLVVESADAVARALRAATSTGADLADALIAIAGTDAGADHTLTFDRKAASLPGMHLLA